MSKNMGISLSWLSALIVAAGTGWIPDAAAQASANFGAAETHKTVQLTRADGEVSVAVRSMSSGIARICDLPSAESVMNNYRYNYPQPIAAIPHLKELRQISVSDTYGADGGVLGLRLRRLLFGSPYVMGSNVTFLASLNPGDHTLHRNCLTAPNFRQWKSELVRVLELYYGLVNPY